MATVSATMSGLAQPSVGPGCNCGKLVILSDLCGQMIRQGQMIRTIQLIPKAETRIIMTK